MFGPLYFISRHIDVQYIPKLAHVILHDNSFEYQARNCLEGGLDSQDHYSKQLESLQTDHQQATTLKLRDNLISILIANGNLGFGEQHRIIFKNLHIYKTGFQLET